VTSDGVETVRRFWESIRHGNLQWETVHPELELRDYDLPDAASVYRGHEGLVSWASLWGDAWQESRLGPTEYVEAGERVLAVFPLWAKGRDTGIEVERQNAIVCEARDGKVVRLDYYATAEEAAAAAGLEPQARGR
jgi:ketosteroid isomerase-like protein